MLTRNFCEDQKMIEKFEEYVALSLPDLRALSDLADKFTRGVPLKANSDLASNNVWIGGQQINPEIILATRITHGNSIFENLDMVDRRTVQMHGDCVANDTGFLKYSDQDPVIRDGVIHVPTDNDSVVDLGDGRIMMVSYRD